MATKTYVFSVENEDDVQAVINKFQTYDGSVKVTTMYHSHVDNKWHFSIQSELDTTKTTEVDSFLVTQGVKTDVKQI